MADTSGETLLELPPSAKLVYLILEHNGAMTQQSLAEESMLPPRTVRYAVSRLEEIGIIIERICILDARKRIYESITDDIDGDNDQTSSVTVADD